MELNVKHQGQTLVSKRTTPEGFATDFREFVQEAFARFPHPIRVVDWTSSHWESGPGEPHWSGKDMEAHLHHALMARHSRMPIDRNVGIAFNKKYVWPGFHWFSVGEHVRALEMHGFQVDRMTNLSPHYAKTTASWYERMMGHREVMVDAVGEATTRAWQIFLAGITGSYLSRDVHVYRLYYVAT